MGINNVKQVCNPLMIFIFLVLAVFKVASKELHNTQLRKGIQARIAQLVAYRLGTGEILGSNPGKGENFSMNIKRQV